MGEAHVARERARWVRAVLPHQLPRARGSSRPWPARSDENPPHLEFMRLPSRLEWPDYYVQIKKPISLHEIRQKLDKAEYSTISEVRTDFNQIFVNAKRYNAPGSAIFLNAKHLHVSLSRWAGGADR